MFIGLDTITMFTESNGLRLLEDADVEEIDEPVVDNPNIEVTVEPLFDSPNAERINETLVDAPKVKEIDEPTRIYMVMIISNSAFVEKDCPRKEKTHDSGRQVRRQTSARTWNPIFSRSRAGEL